jgi:integrator complex subunit 11
MGYQDAKKFPDFPKLIKKFGNKPMNEIVDLVLVSHFHLDHIGRLNFFILVVVVIGVNFLEFFLKK